MAQLRLTLTAALMACLLACAGAFASASAAAAGAGAASPATSSDQASAAGRQAHARRAHKQRAARAARCRRYARKHPRAHAHCATHGHLSASHPAKLAAPRNPPARAGSCAGADEMPSPQNLELIRTATLCLINQERGAHGERALQANQDLQRAAQEHASDMAFGDYFEHVSPSGQTPLNRIRASGYIYNSRVGYVIGENIAWGTLSLATPRAIVKAWLDSPPHLANILNARYRDSAIGVSPHAPSQFAQGQPGGIYSQDFGVIITG